MDNLDKDSFKELVSLVEKIKEKNRNIAPVFAQVPQKLKTFATKTADAILDVKAKLSFDNIKAPVNTRTQGLTENESENIGFAVNWIVSMFKHVLEKIDQQGDIITVHTEALADPKSALDAKDAEIDNLKKELHKVKTEVDETRQRGIKGNLIISSPNRKDFDSLIVHKVEGDGRKKESGLPPDGEERKEHLYSQVGKQEPWVSLGGDHRGDEDW